MDIKTIVAIYFIVNIINAATMTIIWLQYRKRFKGITFWMAEMFLQVIGTGLILMRGNIPDFLSIVVSNTLILSGMLLLLIGLERFLGKKTAHLLNFILVIIFFSLASYYSIIKPDITMREIFISVMIIILGMQICRLMFFKVPGSLIRTTRLTGIVISGYVSMSIVRLILLIIFNPSTNDFFKSGFISGLAMTTFLTLHIFLIIALILMVTGRLLGEVRIQEEKFTKAFHSSPYAIMLTSFEDGKIFEVNEGFLKITGYNYEDVIGKTTIELNMWIANDDRSFIVNRLSENSRIEAFEIQVRKKSGELLTGLLSADIIVISNKKCILSSISDITSRKQSEEKIQKLLREKEIILKEVHHRIKNNMSTVNALLYIQAEDQDNPLCRDILNNAGSRVQSMMTLYDKLYRSDNYRELNIKEFITALTEETTELFNPLIKVKTDINIESFKLKVEILSSIGIIINELITNSMKYAFKETRNGILSISASKNDDKVTVIYSDNGIGLPESVTPGSSSGFGMQLISMLVDQIQGTIKIERDNGTKYTVVFQV